MPIQLTEAEWKIMEVLWDHNPRSMPEITKILEPTTEWTRHTVITLLKRMQDKGSISIDESGSVKMYSPRISKELASTEQTKRFLSRVFSGKASLLINNLVDSGELELEEMQNLLEMMKNKGKKQGE